MLDTSGLTQAQKDGLAQYIGMGYTFGHRTEQTADVTWEVVTVAWGDFGTIATIRGLTLAYCIAEALYACRQDAKGRFA